MCYLNCIIVVPFFVKLFVPINQWVNHEFKLVFNFWRKINRKKALIFLPDWGEESWRKSPSGHFPFRSCINGHNPPHVNADQAKCLGGGLNIKRTVECGSSKKKVNEQSKHNRFLLPISEVFLSGSAIIIKKIMSGF